MKDQDCVQLLKWSLPQLRMRWNGFRRVRGQVCKRIDRRLQELELDDVSAYRSYLERERKEWEALDSLCRVSISRFYRDREVFRSLEQRVLIRLCEDERAKGGTELRCWSIGCASGEEPYTLALIWTLGTGLLFPSMNISVIATDADAHMLQRAREGCYASGSLRELPGEWTTSAFVRKEGRFCIKDAERGKVTFLQQDVRNTEPGSLFHLILCRNLVFTYFERELQKEILARLSRTLHQNGALVLGIHESLPPETGMFEPWPGCRGVFRKK